VCYSREGQKGDRPGHGQSQTIRAEPSRRASGGQRHACHRSDRSRREQQAELQRRRVENEYCEKWDGNTADFGVELTSGLADEQEAEIVLPPS
jgi:hypothetical protein